MLNRKNRTKRVIRLTVALLVLAVAGAAAQMTPEDLMPTGRVVIPGLPTTSYMAMPPTFSVAAEGLDPDGPDGLPVRYRYLVKIAETADGIPIRTQQEYLLYFADVLSVDDPDWSPWLDLPTPPESITIQVADLPVDTYQFLSVQFLDQDGAVSDPWGYQVGTAHLRITSGVFSPFVLLAEQYLGQSTTTEMSFEIAATQPLNFSWTATPGTGAGSIVSYRHGWDLVDVDDPNDPGWAVPPGVGSANLYAVERAFADGIHTFTVRVEDNLGQVRIMIRTLRVVPFVDREYQLPLLVLDQTIDSNVQNWPDQEGNPRNDESYRNAWWHFLAEGIGGVAGLNWDRDWFDHTDFVTYSDLVKYQVVLCYAKANVAQTMFREFRPIDDVDRYVWLVPYQAQGGNLFLVGGSSMESVLEAKSNYMVPMIFTSPEDELIIGGQSYVVGFGTGVEPDGTQYRRGPRMYPYATAGIAALDWTSPNTKYIYNRTDVARFDRNVDCVGLKGLVLAPDFKTNHLIGPGVIADTLWTDAGIDWPDVVSAAADTLELFSLTFPFRDDEFVDANLSSRATPFAPQECTAGPAGRCVEPMFTGIARYDYIREYYWAQGEAEWPHSRYTDYELDTGCGPLALTDYQGDPRGSARTNDQTYGYFSYTLIQDKPVPKADVYWGFDPYRFDHNEAGKAVQWVLQYFGLQINQ